jgi:acetyl-CoA acyltransferase
MAARVAVVEVLRTPFTRAPRGELKDTRPDTLAAHAIRAVIAAVPGLAPERVEDVILGCAMPEGEQGMNVARPAAILAGLPYTVPAMTINRFCSSGVQSVALAAQAIRAGQYSLTVAGGTESMTMIPFMGAKPAAHPELMETRPEVYVSMGCTAENVAARFGVSREEQDRFAYESQRRAALAREKGVFREEIAPMQVSWFDDTGKRREALLAEDTILRPDTTLEGLAKLKPAFNPRGTVTAGNSSPLTDGAAAAVLASEEKVVELGWTPLGWFVDLAVVGVPPEVMGIGPVPAIRKLLERNDLTKEDIDVFEINEAFAAQAAYCVRELGLDPARVNPNGGAIALGHPLGATGTRQTGTLLRELRRRGGKRGIVSMCVGGGMGAAALFEAA